jgi:hypothetical protein
VSTSTAYKKGREAGEMDLPILNNYYERLSPEWHDWRLGWLDAFDARRRERLAHGWHDL